MRIPSSEFESMLAGMPDQGILQISQNPKYMDDPNKAYLVESCLLYTSPSPRD